ncbi:MAG: hypothetical protein Kow0059_15290 [Candidatus Sumerlaeia bacterium]
MRHTVRETVLRTLAAAIVLSGLVCQSACMSPGRSAAASGGLLPGGESGPWAQLKDGALDATPAIQAALDAAAAAGGGEVSLPPGRYRLEGTLTIASGVALSGAWEAPHHARLDTGTVLLAVGGRGSEDGAPLIYLRPNSALRGVTIYYPDQRIEDLVPYPWTIRGEGMHVTIENVTLVNPWRAIDLGSRGNELHLVRNVFGCPLRTGVYVNGCTDIGRIENVHFNPHYWQRDEGDGRPRPDFQRLLAHLTREAEAFVFGRSDWEYVLNTFCYGYRIGYRFIATEQGACNGNFLGIGSDGGPRAVVVEGAQPYGLLITNGEFVAMHGSDPVQVEVLGGLGEGQAAPVVQFSNCAFWGPAAQCVRIGGGRVSFSQCHFHHWGEGAGGSGRAAVEATGGALSVQNCVFSRPGRQVRLGPGVRAAIISGNLVAGRLNIESQSLGDVRIESNAAIEAGAK